MKKLGFSTVCEFARTWVFCRLKKDVFRNFGHFAGVRWLKALQIKECSETWVGDASNGKVVTSKPHVGMSWGFGQWRVDGVMFEDGDACRKKRLSGGMVCGIIKGSMVVNWRYQNEKDYATKRSAKL
ncbi:MAG: hypothetical protein FWH04_00560 [Oscillospiraceae bacterium]|nr:hypothetical protein [Oscillospiraceae bacterium]